jgi:ring-1,2-phenylacetyl-CoA epoxidase subunit PaaC
VSEAATPTGLRPEVRNAVAELLLSLADDEFVIGFADSEWTGIAPFLEEDVAMSSLAQDELGHARAFYGLLADLTGGDADAIAYDREPDGYRHCRLLDHPRGDWALAMARRYLYDTADAVRLDALVGSSFTPLAELVAKIQREERYHLLHVDAWLRRLAERPGPPRDRLLLGLAELAPDATTVFTPLEDEAVLVDAGVLAEPMTELRGRWLRELAVTFAQLELPMPPSATDPGGRHDHSDAFRWLWGELTSVRRTDPAAIW